MKNILILVIAGCGSLLAMEISAEKKQRAEFKYRDFTTGKVVQTTKLITFPVFPENQKPEPYKSIPEGCYFVTNPSYVYALLGPLNPCIGIVIRDPGSGKIVVAHKDHAAKLDSLKDILLREFKSDCFPMLKITLYSEETHKEEEMKAKLVDWN